MDKLNSFMTITDVNVTLKIIFNIPLKVDIIIIIITVFSLSVTLSRKSVYLYLKCEPVNIQTEHYHA